jgi:predicted ArsR family transcriptional regulator
MALFISAQLDMMQMKGDGIQDKTEAALLRTKQQAEDTRQIATKIEQQMAEQEEQMLGIDKDMDELNHNIKRSQKFLGQMAKGAAKDKSMQILCALNVIAILACIGIYAAY